jgi:hypothetical protein
MVQGHLIGPMEILDCQEAWLSDACSFHQFAKKRALATVPRGGVHRVIDTPQFWRLRQIQQVIEKNA